MLNQAVSGPKVFQGDKSQEQLGTCHESGETRKSQDSQDSHNPTAAKSYGHQGKGEFSSLNGCEVAEPSFVSLSHYTVLMDHAIVGFIVQQ